MRVIAGKYKGRVLYPPETERIRPTTDRIKETLFNILYSKGFPDGCRVLDLFSGSGALGIEALSRGAAECVFTDADKSSLKLTSKNLSHVGIKAETLNMDFRNALASCGKFDLILADPPYAAGYEDEILSSVRENEVLLPDGMLVIEHSEKNSLINAQKDYIIDTRRCGNTSLSFLKLR